MTIELGRNDSYPSAHFLFPSELNSTDPVVDNLIDALRATVASPALTALARRTLLAVRQIQGAAGLNHVIDQVAAVCHVTVDDLASRKRTQRLSFCRQIAFYVCRSASGASYPAIGRSLNRDHATTMHGCRVIEQRMQRDAAFRRFIQKLEGQIITGATQTAAAA